jgi:glycosyltransferase involved in cell wall biosynthesis
VQDGVCVTSTDVRDGIGLTALGLRDALKEFDHVASDLVLEGDNSTPPLVTIAIPTFRRFNVLVEAVQSCLAQQFDRPIEIIVVDNDPASRGAEDLAKRLPELKNRNFRYFVNRENIGMFGNFNRCIQRARGQWMTILNDDDLLDHDYLSLMFTVLDKSPRVDGIVCPKRGFTESCPEVVPISRHHQLLKGVMLEMFFLGRSSRRLKARKFFWSSMAGNIVGFMFRREKAVAIGGFYSEDYPSDTWFYARFAKLFHLRQHRKVAAGLRAADNESAKPETLKAFMRNGLDRQRALIDSGDVPKWWRRFSPLILAHDRVEFDRVWGVDIPRAEVEALLGGPLPKDRPYLLWTIRLLMWGF